jgi:putative ABC transport system permease protein
MKSIEMIISNYLLFLSGLIIIISVLLISSIYYRYLKKSHKNIDTLRRIGANSSNIYEIMFYQSILMNSIGCIIGFLLAFACNKPFIEWFGKKGEWIDQEVTFHYVISILIVIIIFGFMQLFMLHFLKKIIRKLPNMAEEEIESKETKHDRIVLDNSRAKKKKLSGKMLFLLVTIGYYCFNVIQNLRYQDVFLSMLFCLFLFFILFYLFSKKIIQEILKGIGKLCNKLGYVYSYIAQKLIFSQMKENIYIILTIMFLIVFSFVGNNFFRMIDSNGKAYNKNKYLKEILIESDGLSYEAGQKLEKSLEGKHIKPLAFYYYPDILFYYNGDVLSTRVEGTSFDKLLEDKIIKKKISKDEAIISSDFAQRYDIKIGDMINLMSYKNLERDSNGNLKFSNYSDNHTYQYKVADISNIGTIKILIDIRANIIDQVKEKLFDRIYLAEDVSIDKYELDKALTELSYQYGTKWSSYQEVLKRDEKIAKEETQLLSICIHTLFIFICFGMLNTLNNILLSRRKEYRVLRQLGVRRGNIVKIMVIQILTFCCIGIILGVLFGCFVISTINFSDLRSFRIQLSLKEILILISILLLFMLGTIPTMKKIISE